MTRTRHLRGMAAGAAAVLVAGLVPLVGPGGSAVAAAACLSEQPTGSVVTTVCDDVEAPVTAITKVQPAPNGKKYINVDHVTFTFAGAHTDADADPIAFECQFYVSINPPADWAPCTSPKTYDGLPDVGPRDPVPYTFRVRAVDSADNAIDAMSCAPIFCTPAGTDVADYDASPGTTALRIDTRQPDTYLFNAPVDEDSDYPMSTSRTVQLRLDASEGTQDDPLKFTCELNRAKVPCSSGITTLRNLGPGDKKFTAVATDLAGNTDPSPAIAKFSVPRNLTSPKGAGWSTVAGGGYFAGDYLQSARLGAQVTAPGKNVRELLLIAPGGPELGKVEVKIGNSIWRTVNLKAANYTRFKIYEIRDQYDPLVSGKIRIRVKSLPLPRSVVRIDAILAH